MKIRLLLRMAYSLLQRLISCFLDVVDTPVSPVTLIFKLESAS